jgi:hypothetical protein
VIYRSVNRQEEASVMRAFLIGSAIAALAVATAAVAAQPAPPPGVAQGTAPAPMAPPAPGTRQVRVMFGGDHVMTRDEVAAHIGKMFAKLDTNRDGFITKDEMNAVHARMEAAVAKVGDVEERLAEHGMFIGDRGAMFDRLDANHDGNISRQEFMAKRPEVHEERVMIMRDGPGGAPGAPLPPMDGHPGMMRMHMHQGGMAMGGHMFEMADANRDGRVSLAEAQSAALAHFDKADLNHDGKITPDERHQVRETIHIERHQS